MCNTDLDYVTGPAKSDGRARLVLFEGNKKPFTASTALISRNISVRRFPWFYPHHQRGSHRPDTAVVVLARPDSRSVDLTSQYSFRHAAHRLSVAGVPLIFPVHSKRTLNRRPRLLRKNNSDPMQRPDDRLLLPSTLQAHFSGLLLIAAALCDVLALP